MRRKDDGIQQVEARKMKKKKKSLKRFAPMWKAQKRKMKKQWRRRILIDAFFQKFHFAAASLTDFPISEKLPPNWSPGGFPKRKSRRKIVRVLEKESAKEMERGRKWGKERDKKKERKKMKKNIKYNKKNLWYLSARNYFFSSSPHFALPPPPSLRGASANFIVLLFLQLNIILLLLYWSRRHVVMADRTWPYCTPFFH